MHFLLVDDDSTYCELVRTALEMSTVAGRTDFERLSDGVEVVPYLEEARRGAHPWPHLILLDQRMPRMDGVDVLRAMRAHATFRSIPVCIMSSSSLATDVGDGYAAGANFWVTKPLAFAKLKSSLEGILMFWSEHVELPPSPRS